MWMPGTAACLVVPIRGINAAGQLCVAFTTEQMERFFEPALQGIAECIDALFVDLGPQCVVDWVLLPGGFSESPLLRERVCCLPQ